jgi:hypothetical protein
MITTQAVHKGGTRFGLQHGYNTVLGARFAKNPLVLDIPIYITGMSELWRLQRRRWRHPGGAPMMMTHFPAT